MVIGILTHPLRKNYGGILQNWALQQTLKKLGYKSITINWRSDIPDWKEYISLKTLRLFISYLYHTIKPPKIEFPRTPRWKDPNAIGIQKFVITHLNITKRISKRSVSEYASRYDTIIVGSDQVWRPKYISNIEMMFLPFKKQKKQKKIAFSASFGTDNWEYTKDQTEVCKRLVHDFDIVSLREYSGIELCKKHFNIDNTEWTLDPTLLIDKEMYEELCKDVIIDEKEFLFAYILDDTDITNEMCSRACEFMKIPIKKIGVDSRTKASDTIESWLASFKHAKYVITDSFHGTVFSIIFHKPFALFYNSSRGNARFNSLIKLFPQINERIISGNVLPQQPIDWNAIDNTIRVFKDNSITFLRKALS